VDRTACTAGAVGVAVEVGAGADVEVAVTAATGMLVGVGPLAGTDVAVGTRTAALVGVDAPALLPQPASKSVHAATTNNGT
jgi:hypothetical protein